MEEKLKEISLFSNDFVVIKTVALTEQKENFLVLCLKVLVRFSGRPKNKEMNDYLNHIGKIYRFEIPFIIIYDASDIGMLSLAEVTQQADFMRIKDLDTRRLIKACAIVLTNQIAKGLLNTLFTFKQPACPYKVVSSMNEAHCFLKSSKMA